MTDEPCRLYLILPEDAGTGFPETFEAAIQAGDVACALLPARLASTQVAGRIVSIARERQVELLVETDLGAAKALGADGVHIPAREDLYARARERLGPRATVGVHAGLSRHQGLSLAELGADYVAFGAESGRGSGLDDIVAWWGEIVVVPCVAWDVADLSQARLLAQMGADFVAVGDPVWQHPGSAADAVREWAAALERARDAA